MSLGMFASALRWLIIICVLGYVLNFAIFTDQALPDHWRLRGHNDTVLHIGAFLCLTFICTLNSRYWLQLALGLGVLAVLIEGVQFWIPRRTAGLDDVLASLTGVFIGLCLSKIVEACWRFCTKKMQTGKE